MSTVSIVIPTLNRPTLLLEAIDGALLQTRAPLEVIVVDDGSNPPVDAQALVSRFGGSVRVLRNDSPQGLAWARNQGVEAAQGDYIVHLDDDDLFAAELVSDCAALLDADAEIDLVFVGVQGFGGAAAHFNRVHPEGTAKVIRQGGGRALGDGVYSFEGKLVHGLLNQVPMPFQRVMARRDVWHKVSRLRRDSYRHVFRVASEAEAKNLIRGTLRDSEWALYASMACRKLALVDRPLYLQRCEGQGASSQPAMRDVHLRQSLSIKSVMAGAAASLPELMPFREPIRSSLAQSHFNASYQFANAGQRSRALAHLLRSFGLQPRLRHVKLLARVMIGRPTATHAAAADPPLP